MVTLENGELTDLEYQSNIVSTVWVCQACRKIFDTDPSIRQHFVLKHGELVKNPADVVL